MFCLPAPFKKLIFENIGDNLNFLLTANNPRLCWVKITTYLSIYTILLKSIQAYIFFQCLFDFNCLLLLFPIQCLHYFAADVAAVEH